MDTSVKMKGSRKGSEVWHAREYSYHRQIHSKKEDKRKEGPGEKADCLNPAFGVQWARNYMPHCCRVSIHAAQPALLQNYASTPSHPFHAGSINIKVGIFFLSHWSRRLTRTEVIEVITQRRWQEEAQGKNKGRNGTSVRAKDNLWERENTRKCL